MYKSNIYWELRRRYWAKFVTKNVSPIVIVGLVCWAAYMFILIINFPSMVTPIVITLN